MRPIVVAANWKMHTTPGDAGALAALIAARTDHAEVTRVICPPFVCLAAVHDALAGTDVATGAQNIHHERTGPYTGDVSAPMLAGVATWVIVGHSERRRDACETDAQINGKLFRALEHDLRPILCVGEQLGERETGRASRVVERQVRSALAGHDATLVDAGLVIAYEPVWAIGTGVSASPADAAEMADVVRAAIEDARLGGVDADDVPVLYGGSVTSANFGAFITEPTIDGALVGGASLKADEMAGIVARAAVTARARRAVPS